MIIKCYNPSRVKVGTVLCGRMFAYYNVHSIDGNAPQCSCFHVLCGHTRYMVAEGGSLRPHHLTTKQIWINIEIPDDW